ncbi:MAG: CRISPR-associated endonuclease Cas1 [Planctomycetes bacterium]|nr:CRISPR-associated endonuclease Cas1 [Planctomycetota bacterium]
MTHLNPEHPELIPARGLNEFAYCPRLYHLMYVQGLFDDSADTIEGRDEHKRRRSRKKVANAPVESETDEAEEPLIPQTPWSKNKVLDVTLSCETLGVTGKFDSVFESESRVFPVEDKHGSAPDISRKQMIGAIQLESSFAWGNDQMQLAAQIHLLRANGYNCSAGNIYYRKNNLLVEIKWDQPLESALKLTVEQIRALDPEKMPAPLFDSPKCVGCSLNHICLPDEYYAIEGKIEEPRRLLPGRDDAGILYLTAYGTHLSKSGENAEIRIPGGAKFEVPIKEVAHVCVFGASQITTQTIMELLDRGASVSFFTTGGWLRGVVTPPVTKNVFLRKSQFQKFAEPSFCLDLARNIASAKIANQYTLIRRNIVDQDSPELISLKNSVDNALGASNLAELLGIEGFAARNYFDLFSKILKPPKNDIEMSGRNKRPPKDPVNVLLSFGYTLLMRDFYSAIIGVGMDPLFGFYHQPVLGRPSLALDLMEAFRPLIVDSAILRVINEGTFNAGDFLTTKGHSAFKGDARKRWIVAYERRVDELVTHPAFGYRLSYRRVFNLEVRLLARFLEGEIKNYEPLRTR